MPPCPGAPYAGERLSPHPTLPGWMQAKEPAGGLQQPHVPASVHEAGNSDCWSQWPLPMPGFWVSATQGAAATGGPGTAFQPPEMHPFALPSIATRGTEFVRAAAMPINVGPNRMSIQARSAPPQQLSLDMPGWLSTQGWEMAAQGAPNPRRNQSLARSSCSALAASWSTSLPGSETKLHGGVGEMEARVHGGHLVTIHSLREDTLHALLPSSSHHASPHAGGPGTVPESPLADGAAGQQSDEEGRGPELEMQQTPGGSLRLASLDSAALSHLDRALASSLEALPAPPEEGRLYRLRPLGHVSSTALPAAAPAAAAAAAADSSCGSKAPAFQCGSSCSSLLDVAEEQVAAATAALRRRQSSAATLQFSSSCGGGASLSLSLDCSYSGCSRGSLMVAQSGSSLALSPTPSSFLAGAESWPSPTGLLSATCAAAEQMQLQQQQQRRASRRGSGNVPSPAAAVPLPCSCFEALQEQALPKRLHIPQLPGAH